MAYADYSNIEAVFNKDFKPSSFAAKDIKFGEHYGAIDVTEIIDVYVFDFDNSNYNFSERLGKLKTNQGWVHLAGGLSLGVKDQKIDNIMFSKKNIQNLAKFNKNEVIELLGIPDLELDEGTSYGGIDYVVEYYILVYQAMMLNVYLEPEKMTIAKLSIGGIMNENTILTKKIHIPETIFQTIKKVISSFDKFFLNFFL
jgi:hypothetical protein